MDTRRPTALKAAAKTPPSGLTVAGAADVAAKHAVTIRKALERGDLHGYQTKVGGRWTILPDCLGAWMSGRPCRHQQSKASA